MSRPARSTAVALATTGAQTLGACQAWGVEGEIRPHRVPFLPSSQSHGWAMGQEHDEELTAAADLQPTLPRSARLLGSRAPRHARGVHPADRAARRAYSTIPAVPGGRRGAIT